MIIEPIGKPKPKPIPFGVYKKTVITEYGNKVIGECRGFTITIHNDTKKNIKVIYLEKAKKWIKSKLIFFDKGVKNIIRSKSE